MEELRRLKKDGNHVAPAWRGLQDLPLVCLDHPVKLHKLALINIPVRLQFPDRNKGMLFFLFLSIKISDIIIYSLS